MPKRVCKVLHGRKVCWYEDSARGKDDDDDDDDPDDDGMPDPAMPSRWPREKRELDRIEDNLRDLNARLAEGMVGYPEEEELAAAALQPLGFSREAVQRAIIAAGAAGAVGAGLYVLRGAARGGLSAGRGGSSQGYFYDFRRYLESGVGIGGL